MVQIRSTLPAWDDLEAILLVSRSKSIRAAAEELGVAHTTLARRIEAAEDRLGVKAFVRSTQGYALTEAGQTMVAFIERMAEEADALRRGLGDADRVPQGLVRVSLPPAVLTHCIMAALPRFHLAYPRITLDFDVRYSFSDLDRNDADVAVRYQAKPQDHLVGVKIGNSVEQAYAAPAVLARHVRGDIVPLIAWARNEVFLRRAKSLRLDKLPIAFCCVDVQSQLAMAELGLGIVILPSLVGNSSTLVQPLSPTHSIIASSIWVLTHPDLAKSARIKTVTTFLADTLREALGQRDPASAALN